MEFEELGVLYSMLIAILGSLCAYFIVPHNAHRLLDSYRIVRRIVLGAGAGLVYYYLMVYYGVPNHIAQFFFGWTAENFLYAIASRMPKTGFKISTKSLKDKLKLEEEE